MACTSDGVSRLMAPWWVPSNQRFSNDPTRAYALFYLWPAVYTYYVFTRIEASVAVALNAVIAQRLIRRVCETCAEPMQPNARQITWLRAQFAADVEQMVVDPAATEYPDEYLQAAEYILSEGNQQVFLCERGIRTFETSTRNTLDLSAVPVLRQRTHLPVIVDPSHAAGNRDLVAPLAFAAVAAGADGLIIEVHPDPEHALSDGDQSLTLQGFDDLMRRLRPFADAAGRTMRAAESAEVVAA